MDGVILAVVHDEFRGMGLSGVRGVVGEGAVVVDVRGMIDAGGGGKDGCLSAGDYELSTHAHKMDI